MLGDRPYRWLALLPALAILVGVPFVNGHRAFVFGLPLLLFWIVACVVATSVVMALIGALDRRHAARRDRSGPSGTEKEPR
jgi:drug/metabolite transporter (DMT)-like permease